MSVSNGEQTRFWREIEELLAQARVVRPLHHAEALLDLGRVVAEEGAGTPLIARLTGAMDGWDGRLIVPLADDALAPALRAGDRLVVDPLAEPREGDLILAYAGGALVARTLARRGGRQWLVAGADVGIPLGPGVAILGVAVEARCRLAAPRRARAA